MTTTRMNATWVEWDDTRTSIVAWGTSQVEWVGERSLSYSYQDGWTGANPPPADIFPRPGGVRFDLGDGSVRFISDVVDGTSNTIFQSEVAGDAPFSGAVWGITDRGTGREYYIGLDAPLPSVTGLGDGSVRFLFESLTANALQIIAGSRAPGEPILLDGTSNTVLVTENDSYEGDGSDNRWSGGIGKDTLRGGAGADDLNGEEGKDRLFGDTGTDTLSGGAGRDLLNGGTEADLLFGGLGLDTLYGGGGNDRLFGGDPLLADPGGDDNLFGGSGADSLYGGVGDDILDGGGGADVLVLGAGADAIVFAVGSGRDLVADFSTMDGDLLQLNANLLGGAATGAAVVAAFATVNTTARVVLDFGGGAVMDLRAAAGTSLASLADHIDII